MAPSLRPLWLYQQFYFQSNHQLLLLFLNWYFWSSFKCTCSKLLCMINKFLAVFTNILLPKFLPNILLFFFPYTIKQWNEVSLEIRNSESYSIFNKSLLTLNLQDGIGITSITLVDETYRSNWLCIWHWPGDVLKRWHRRWWIAGCFWRVIELVVGSRRSPLFIISGQPDAKRACHRRFA